MSLLDRIKTYRPDPVTLVLLGVLAYLWMRPFAWEEDVDTSAPILELTTTKGQVTSLEALRGQVVLVNYWATWCGFCKKEMPEMERFYADYHARGFEILALSVDDDENDLSAYLLNNPHSFPVALARGSARRAFGPVEKLPTSFVIDRTGKIRKKVEGQVYYGRLERLVVPLLEPEPSGGS